MAPITFLSGRAEQQHARNPRLVPSTLARRITKAASKQTYYTIRYLVDKPLVELAYNAYAYFRWVDDRLDAPSTERADNLAFIQRQQDIILETYAGRHLPRLTSEEHLLTDLIRSDTQPCSGLRSYIDHMMAVMAFDAGRRYCVVSKHELAQYTRNLAIAVTDALHYFIGHDTPPLRNAARYLAVTGAHITHLLRDTYEDVANGYYNIPAEYLRSHDIQPTDINRDAYRAWVISRVGYARQCFAKGKRYLAQVPSARCRMAGYAYTARFEQVLDMIQQEDFQLRPTYPERKTLRGTLGLAWSTLAMLVDTTAEAAV